MQLRNARLCLDCEEVHDATHCPLCASESFAFITRWVPSPSADQDPQAAQAGPPPPARVPPREGPPATQPVEAVSRETLDSYRQLLTGQPAPSNWRFVKRGALGLAIFGLAGWAWKQQNQQNQRTSAAARDEQQNPDRD
jgi:hypothetical protein